MTEAEEKEIDKLNSGRILREASRELLPFLEGMKADAVAHIIQAHRAHEHAKLPAYAAELSVLETMLGRISRNNKETERREGKMYGDRREQAAGE